MDAWVKWMGKHKKFLVDGGAPLGSMDRDRRDHADAGHVGEPCRVRTRPNAKNPRQPGRRCRAMSLR
jgi:hypothetical protein